MPEGPSWRTKSGQWTCSSFLLMQPALTAMIWQQIRGCHRLEALWFRHRKIGWKKCTGNKVWAQPVRQLCLKVKTTLPQWGRSIARRMSLWKLGSGCKWHVDGEKIGEHCSIWILGTMRGLHYWIEHNVQSAHLCVFLVAVYLVKEAPNSKGLLEKIADANSSPRVPILS